MNIREAMGDMLAQAEEKFGYPLHVTAESSDENEVLTCVLPVRNGKPQWVKKPRPGPLPYPCTFIIRGWDRAAGKPKAEQMRALMRASVQTTDHQTAQEFPIMIAPQKNDPEVLAAIERFQKKFPHPCRLCGQIGSDGIVGVYKPPTRDLPRFGFPEGKDGYFIYRLCPSCAQIPDSPRRIEEKLDATFFNRGKLDLDAAVEAYSKGIPVIVYSTEGGVIHGRETMKAVIDTGIQLECVAIHDVAVDDWNDSDWPEVLEAARQVFMRRGGFKLPPAGEIEEIDDDE